MIDKQAHEQGENYGRESCESASEFAKTVKDMAAEHRADKSDRNMESFAERLGDIFGGKKT